MQHIHFAKNDLAW